MEADQCYFLAEIRIWVAGWLCVNAGGSTCACCVYITISSFESTQKPSQGFSGDSDRMSTNFSVNLWFKHFDTVLRRCGPKPLSQRRKKTESFWKHFCLQWLFLIKLENCKGTQNLILGGLMRLVSWAYVRGCIFSNWLSETSDFYLYPFPTHLSHVARVRFISRIW